MRPRATPEQVTYSIEYTNTLRTQGVFALTVYLSDIRGGRSALGDMVLSILGTRLLLSIYGLHTYAVPALGGAYLNGQQDAIEPDNIIFGNPSASILYAAFLIYSAGFILFGFAIWGSETLPRWAGVLLTIHAPLLSGALPELFSILGALLLVAGSGWTAFAVLRRPPTQKTGGRVEAEAGSNTAKKER